MFDKGGEDKERRGIDRWAVVLGMFDDMLWDVLCSVLECKLEGDRLLGSDSSKLESSSDIRDEWLDNEPWTLLVVVQSWGKVD